MCVGLLNIQFLVLGGSVIMRSQFKRGIIAGFIEFNVLVSGSFPELEQF